MTASGESEAPVGAAVGPVVAVVESAMGMDHAIATFGDVDTLIATTSPFVLERCRGLGRRCFTIDSSLSQCEADTIGYAALRAARDLADFVDAAAKADEPPFGWALLYQLHRMLTAYLYKACLLDRVKRESAAEGRLWTVGRPEAQAVRGFNVMVNRFDTLFTVLGSRTGVPHLPLQAREPSGAAETGDFMRPSAWTRLVTLMNAPATSVFYRLWRGPLKGRTLALDPRRNRRPVIAVHRGNELIEEILPRLLLRGCEIRRPPRLRLTGAPVEVPEAINAAAIAARIESRCVQAGLAWSETTRIAARLAGERAVEALRYGPSLWRATEACVEELKRDARGRSAGFLSNSMGSAQERLLRHALDCHDIQSFVAEHGVAPGLSPLHDALYSIDSAAGLRRTLLYTPAQRRLLEKTIGVAEAASCPTIGAPRLVRRIGLRPVQRIAVRAALGAKGRLAIWCTGLYPNNFQFLPHYWRDTPYHDIRRRLVTEVFGRIPDQVVLKLYPTYRYVDPDPLSGLMALPPNCRVEQFTDFRNLRAAADIVIVDGPGSVMAWAWSTNVPFIFLETRMYVLDATVREALGRSAFVVDVADEDWAERLLDLLRLDHATLVARFAAKRVERENFAAQYALGPRGGAGRRGSAFIHAALIGHHGDGAEAVAMRAEPRAESQP